MSYIITPAVRLLSEHSRRSLARRDPAALLSVRLETGEQIQLGESCIARCLGRERRGSGRACRLLRRLPVARKLGRAILYPPTLGCRHFKRAREESCTPPSSPLWRLRHVATRVYDENVSEGVCNTYDHFFVYVWVGMLACTMLYSRSLLRMVIIGVLFHWLHIYFHVACDL